MQELTIVTGMILKSEPMGEYDRRVVLLTKERGKISAFAKGARKQGNRLMASTNPFSFGEFKLFEGRSSYTINDALISNYFEGMREDFDAACYGMYFLELMDYYTRENNDEVMMLKLLFLSVRTLLNPRVNKKLVKCVFEIKALVLNGEYPGPPTVPGVEVLNDSTLYTLEYIVGSSIEKLYSFNVSDEVLGELIKVCRVFSNKYIDRSLKSLEILDEL